jgi:hypothetical protein
MNNEIYAVYKTFWLSSWIETSYSEVGSKDRYEVLDNNGRLRRDVSNPNFISTIHSICLTANQHSVIFKLFNQLMYGFSCLYCIICHDYANPYSLRQHKHHSCAHKASDKCRQWKQMRMSNASIDHIRYLFLPSVNLGSSIISIRILSNDGLI